MEKERKTSEHRQPAEGIAGARIRTYASRGIRPPRVGVVDYGAGNIQSMCNALGLLGADVARCDGPDSLAGLDGLVLPGVGAFPAAMHRLRQTGMADALREAVAVRRAPVLGVCLGMQLLSQSSEEFGHAEGLGLVPGRTALMESPGLPLPHVGWNNVEIRGESPMFAGIPGGTHFYFDHSYAVSCPEASVAGASVYGAPFVAAFCAGHVWGTQFHPEKSQLWGLRLLRNFLDRVAGEGAAC